MLYVTTPEEVYALARHQITLYFRNSYTLVNDQYVILLLISTEMDTENINNRIEQALVQQEQLMPEELDEDDEEDYGFLDYTP